MEIYNDLIQLSPEWFDLRKMCLTGSHATAIGNQGAGLKTYVLEKMAEYYSSAPKESYSNHHTERGNELEPEAAMVFSYDYNVEVRKVGFVKFNDFVGVSPDLFVGEDELGEIKCLADKGHMRMLLGETIDSGFVWQVQMQLLVCQKKVGNLIFYNPNYENYLIVHRIFPDKAKFIKLLAGFAMGEKMLRAIESKMEAAKKLKGV